MTGAVGKAGPRAVAGAARVLVVTEASLGARGGLRADLGALEPTSHTA